MSAENTAYDENRMMDSAVGRFAEYDLEGP